MKRREVVTIVVAVLVVGLLFVALKLSGGGNPKSASENPTASNESAEPSGDTPKSLSDADVERLLKEAVDMESVDLLEQRYGLSYKVGETEPYSGWASRRYISGPVVGLFRYKDGKPELVLGWHKNGQKSVEEKFKDGKRDRLSTSWHENGEKRTEGTYKDGKRDGRWTGWHENGQMEFLNNFKDGKLDGLRREWHENGQKRGEETFKDGKANGLRTTWHENGQKAMELTVKDGELVSRKLWNSKGEEVDTQEKAFK